MEPTPEEQELWDLQQIKQGHSHLFARPIGTVMRRLLARKEYGSIQATQALGDLWVQIVGARLAGATRLGKIRRGKLLVEVNSSQALHELHFRKNEIIKRLQTELAEQRISDWNLKIASF